MHVHLNHYAPFLPIHKRIHDPYSMYEFRYESICSFVTSLTHSNNKIYFLLNTNKFTCLKAWIYYQIKIKIA